VEQGSSYIKLPMVGVVIVNYNNFNDTIRYINRQLIPQENTDLNIVVVDNASTDNSKQMLETEFSGNEKVTIIANDKNSGYAAGNNIGIKFLEKENCRYIIISNTDIEIDNRMLISGLITHYQLLDNIAFISPLMVVDGKPSIEYMAWRLPDKAKEILNSTFLTKLLGYWYINKFYYKLNKDKSIPVAVDCLPGSFFMGSIDAFRGVEYFDENTFLYYEETILGSKVKSLKMNNFLIPELLFNHLTSSTIDKVFSNWRKHKILIDSKIYYWKRYMGASWSFIALIKILFILYSIEQFLLTPFLKIKKHLTIFSLEEV
jgi:GT2 family glycosyltransferase